MKLILDLRIRIFLFFLFNDKCVECDISCRTCNRKSEESCTSCNYGYYEFNRKNKKVPVECNEGYFADLNSQCQPCSFGHHLLDSKCTPFEEECETQKHCQNINTNLNNYVQITVEKTTYSSFHFEDGGGALRLINCAVESKGNTFSSCISNKGAGGGMYVYNNINTNYDISKENPIVIVDTKFNNCEASYGGALFLYSSSPKNPILIDSCHFKDNLIKNDEKNY